MIYHFTAFTMQCVCKKIRSLFWVLGMHNFGFRHKMDNDEALRNVLILKKCPTLALSGDLIGDLKVWNLNEGLWNRASKLLPFVCFQVQLNDIFENIDDVKSWPVFVDLLLNSPFKRNFLENVDF